MAGRAADGRLPGLVCLDEPTRGMDRARKEELASWAGGLADGGAAVVVATHDVEFAAAFAERVVLLGDGELIADGPVGEILSGGWYFATEVARILGVGRRDLARSGAPSSSGAGRSRHGGAAVSWQLAVYALLALVLAGGLRLVRALAPAGADGRAGRGAGGARGRRAARLRADPERRSRPPTSS